MFPCRFRFKISLQITHPVISATTITEQLGMRPRHSFTAGQVKRTPKGTIVRDVKAAVPVVATHTYWTHPWQRTEARSSAPGGAELVRSVDKLTRSLAPQKRFLRSLVRTGGEASVKVGLFLDDSNADWYLPASTIASLAGLGLGIRMDTYSADEPATPRIARQQP